jgi:urease accessory protein UreE
MENFCSVILLKCFRWRSDIFSFEAMTVVEQLVQQSDLAPRFDRYRHDTLTLKWEERRQGHGKRRTDGGVEFAISLPNGTILKAGDCMILEAEQMIVRIREASEPVYIVTPTTPQDWAYYAYHAGNRHQQVMIGERELIFLQNPAVRSLLEQLHVPFETGERPFTGALANVHAH